MSGGKLDASRAALLVVDVQEAFRKAVPGFDDLSRASAALVQGAEAVGIPIVVTEQYPKGLGRTVADVARHLPDDVKPIEKVSFSASRADGFDLGGRDQVLVCGIEAHVCVNQTVLDLLEDGLEVHVAQDAVGSRFERDRQEMQSQIVSGLDVTDRGAGNQIGRGASRPSGSRRRRVKKPPRRSLDGWKSGRNAPMVRATGRG